MAGNPENGKLESNTLRHLVFVMRSYEGAFEQEAFLYGIRELLNQRLASWGDSLGVVFRNDILSCISDIDAKIAELRK
jgi:hypothetical protein